MEKLTEISKLIVDDLQLNQMIEEQDLIDRKQIGLFGTKKNQQILGTNQYAMSNNYAPMTTKNENSANGEFWDLRNKKLEYN